MPSTRRTSRSRSSRCPARRPSRRLCRGTRTRRRRRSRASRRCSGPTSSMPVESREGGPSSVSKRTLSVSIKYGTHAVADRPVMEVETVGPNQRALEYVVDDPQRSTEGGTDSSAAACRCHRLQKTRSSHWDLVAHQSSSRQGRTSCQRYAQLPLQPYTGSHRTRCRCKNVSFHSR